MINFLKVLLFIALIILSPYLIGLLILAAIFFLIGIIAKFV